MTKCPHCGGAGKHPGICPSIKAIEYYENGSIKRVEYKTASDYYTPSPTYVPYPYPVYPNIYPIQPIQPLQPYTVLCGTSVS